MKFFFLCLSLWLAWAAPSFAEESEGEAAKTEHEEGPVHRLHLGIHGGARGSFEGKESEAFYGGGLFVTVIAIHEWLEIELVVDGVYGTHDVEDAGVVHRGQTFRLPIDLLLKKPFHISQTFHPFVGLGPTFIYERETSSGIPATTRGIFGGTVAVGTDIWLGERVALVAEVAYSLLASHSLEHEIGGSLGVLIAF